MITRVIVPRILPLLVAAAFFLHSPLTLSAHVVINEVLYDPDGSDSGHEFVELMNCGASGILLTGWVLETGNGANPDDWTVEWIGGDLDYLDPGGIFLIGESDVVPAPDYETPLDLQNGPDAARLTDGFQVVDLVGWGEPLFQGYYEGSPAEDTASGYSLARIPDCYDNDANSLDFSSSVPTPGYRNALEHDLSIRVLHAGRVILPADEPVRVECRIENVGSVPIEAGSALLRLFADDSQLPTAAEIVDEELAPRDTLLMFLTWHSPAAGYHTGRVVLDHGEDDSTDNNTATTSFTVGRAGALVALNEIMHSPLEGATEWLELVNVSGESLSLAGWMIGDDADASMISSVTPGEEILLPPDGFLVVARDPELVTAAAPVVESEHWEALSVNDHVALLDRFGTPIDVVIYSSNW
ncbi:lamin tail domain-containing protein, partial [bacterium]|nr:lamin tail domain-containing protein [bacterium]